MKKENLDFKFIQNKKKNNNPNKKQINSKIIEIIEINENNKSKNEILNNIEIDINKINSIEFNIQYFK